MKKMAKRVGLRRTIKGIGISLWAAFCLFSSDVVYAGSMITLDQDDMNSGQGVETSAMHIIQTKFIPIVMLAVVIGVVWGAISVIWNGVSEYQRDSSSGLGAIKKALIVMIIVLVAGGMVLYILENARTYSFGG